MTMVESKELHWIKAVGKNTVDLDSALRWEAKKRKCIASEIPLATRSHHDEVTEAATVIETR